MEGLFVVSGCHRVVRSWRERKGGSMASATGDQYGGSSPGVAHSAPKEVEFHLVRRVTADCRNCLHPYAVTLRRYEEWLRCPNCEEYQPADVVW